MKSIPVMGTDGGKRAGWFFSFYEQWSGFLGRCAWYDFTIIDISGEFAPYSGRCEFTLALLGLRVTLTYVYDDSFNREMRETIEKIKNEEAS